MTLNLGYSIKYRKLELHYKSLTKENPEIFSPNLWIVDVTQLRNNFLPSALHEHNITVQYMTVSSRNINSPFF